MIYSTVVNCHPERSEGSARLSAILPRRADPSLRSYNGSVRPGGRPPGPPAVGTGESQSALRARFAGDSLPETPPRRLRCGAAIQLGAALRDSPGATADPA